MTIDLPVNVEYIINTLEENNFEAYAVGGCVRDSVLGRIPDDWDITTSATPEQIKSVFLRTVDTGIKHGTVTVLVHDGAYEVTTYRIDGEYLDGRHPKQVVFTDNLVEDLRRRDFTINAMAYNKTRGFVDEFGGIKDLKDKVIRCVGNADERFDEDALRIFRAVRFGAQLGFVIDQETKESIKRHKDNLLNVSAERIQTELVKLLISKEPDRIREVYELGITSVVLPEFDRMEATQQNTKHHAYNVGEHTIRVMQNVPPDKILRIAALLHDVAKPQVKTTDEDGADHFYGHPQEGEKTAKSILRRLKFDNDTISKVTRIIRWHDYRPNADMQGMRRFLNKVGEDLYEDILILKNADTLAQSMYERDKKLKLVSDYKKICKEIIDKQQCFSLKQLKVTGKDLIDCGMESGKDIGVMLGQLLEYVMDYPEKNQRDVLLEYVNKTKNKFLK